MSPPRLVLVSGFTAAGKTTHCRLLAAFLGWAYIGMSQVRRHVLPDSWSAGAEWTARGDRLRATDHGLDLQMDLALSEAVDRLDGPAVVDAWLQPWLCESRNAVRVWLASDFDSRIRKAEVSRLRAGIVPDNRTRDEITAKDQFSVDHFQRLYGIPFGPDTDLFDLIVDNSAYIPEATIAASDAGIAQFGPVFNRQAAALLRATADV